MAILGKSGGDPGWRSGSARLLLLQDRHMDSGGVAIRRGGDPGDPEMAIQGSDPGGDPGGDPGDLFS